MSFEKLNLHPLILKAVIDSGYTSPTPIQEQAIPELLAGHDIMASAQTGTGKTAAFMLPALHRLASPSKVSGRGPRVLVLTPTRELALQVSEAASKYGKHLARVRVVSILGGMPYPLQNKLLSQPVEILVATPGRLIDHIQRGRIDFSRLEMLVLDEADRMLDMGFIDDVEKIASATPANRQTLLFSATLDSAIANIAARLLKSPKRIQIATSAAQLQANQALLRSAQLNLEYATVVAPISGRIGDSLIQPGGLVTKNSAQPLTTIVPLDTIWVRFKVSEADYLKRGGTEGLRHTPLELLLADNAVFPYKGHIENSTNEVDPKTGTLELQATFPNPKHVLLPGQFGRIRLQVREQQDALLVPQRAVEELQGAQSVLTVGEGNKAQARSVVLGDRAGSNWIVEQGLKPGDRVIVDGLMTLRPGAPVSPQPFRPAASESEQK